MKKNILFIVFVYSISYLVLLAQTDVTNLISNPSFEDNVDDFAIGWNYNEDAQVCAWHVINTDGDETKTDENIMGLWNATIGDATVSQTITGLENGTYKLTADMMCSRNASSLRLTTQRIFINDKSVLFGVNADSNYAASDLEILTGTLGESITFAGHTVSPVGKENGPFWTCEVTDTITDGTITIGVKTNGSDSQYGFEFPLLTEGDGYGWFKVDNFTLTLEGTSTGIKDTYSDNTKIKVLVRNGYIIVDGIKDFKIYTLNGMLISSDSQLIPGIYIIKANNETAKVAVLR